MNFLDLAQEGQQIQLLLTLRHQELKQPLPAQPAIFEYLETVIIVSETIFKKQV